MGWVCPGKSVMILQGAFEAGGAFEANSLGGFNLHCFTSLGVAAHAGSALFDLECAKSNELDFTIILYTGSNAAKYCFKGIFCRTLGGVLAKGLLNGVDEFGFIHNDVFMPLFNAHVKLNNCLFFLGIA
jgi:hypothetical protein